MLRCRGKEVGDDKLWRIIGGIKGTAYIHQLERSSEFLLKPREPWMGLMLTLK